MESLKELMNKIDDIKKKINNEEYLDIVDDLKDISESYSGLYKFTFFKQEKVLKFGNSTDLNRYIFIPKRFTQIVKLKKRDFSNDSEIRDFIFQINYHTFFEKTSYGQDLKSLYIDYTTDIPTLSILNDGDKVEMRDFNLANEKNTDYDSDNDDIYIKMSTIIPLKIEEM